MRWVSTEICSCFRWNTFIHLGLCNKITNLHPALFNCLQKEDHHLLLSKPNLLYRNLSKTRLTRLKALLLFNFCLAIGTTFAQINPYHLNGNAYQENCHCYTLTNDAPFLMGSIWNVNKIDLTVAFDYHFNVFLGCHDDDGADGIAFVLQPLGTSIGTPGEGIGIQGVSPSAAIVIDTYQNYNREDPSYDHISINLNGDVNHSSPNNIAGPVTAIEGSDNIEDCEWHVFRIVWDPSAKLLSAYIDGKLRVSSTVDLVNDVFHSDPKVFWGFTGATGGYANRQRFCTSLNAAFTVPADQVTCFPTPINFLDSSTSFGKIVNWMWDFGDGTKSNLEQPAQHVFPAPGDYIVKLNIVGNDGCVSDTFSQKIVAGSKPTAKFTTPPPPFCTERLVPFDDVSVVDYGTIMHRIWNTNGVTAEAGPEGIQTTLLLGANNISLLVSTKEGCVSDLYDRDIQVYKTPVISMNDIRDMCKSEDQSFSANVLSNDVPIKKWHWDFGDGKIGSASPLQHSFRDTGKYMISVYGLSDAGCPSDTMLKPITIYGTNAFAGRDTVVSVGQPLQLQGSGGDSYWWSPSFGLSNPTISNPVATLLQDVTYVLTANSPANCPTSDTIHIKVYKGPDLYVPTAFTPNADGKNDVFRFVAAGMQAVHYFKVFNRYGQQLFSSASPSRGWDGNFKGLPQPTGTYVWMIEAVDYLGNLVRKQGFTVLIR